MEYVGTAIPPIKARPKAAGESRYAADLKLPGMAWARFVRSPHPHARILRIDAGPALRVPGVLAVYTAKDVGGTNRAGITVKDQPLLCEEMARYQGDPVALVVAETEEVAELGVHATAVEYEVLPAVLDPEEALAPGAPAIHPSGNLTAERRIMKGDIQRAIRDAAVAIEKDYTTAFNEHGYLEPEAGLAFLDGQGRVVVVCCTQHSHYNRTSVADLLGIPPDQVRISQAETGGGFGGKLDLHTQGAVALAALKLRRPVKMVYSRPESMMASGKRHAFRIKYLTAADGDGRLLGVRVDLLLDGGAYASYGPGVGTRAAVHATGPYRVPNVEIVARRVYTNKPFCGAMRGFGNPQVLFAAESQMDLVAERLGMSPLAIRRLNALRAGDATGTGQVLRESVGALKTLEAIADYMRQHDVRLGPAAKGNGQGGKGPIRRGWGLGTIWYGIGNTAMTTPAEARVAFDEAGCATLYTAASDIGQGMETIFLQIAAEELGVTWEQMRVRSGDTDFGGDAGSTSASKQAYSSGNAIKAAAAKAREALLREAGEYLGVDAGSLWVKGDRIFTKADPSVRSGSASIADVVRHAHANGRSVDGQHTFTPPATPLDAEGQGSPYATYSYASHLAQVEVDVETGLTRVLKVVAAHDVGFALNPQAVEGQIEGGIAMGMGFALLEEYIPGKTNSLATYLTLASKDAPEMTPIILEDRESTGPFGAKGVGELAQIPTAPAIVNAIAAATGARVFHLPATPERVLGALRLREEKGGGVQ